MKLSSITALLLLGLSSCKHPDICHETSWPSFHFSEEEKQWIPRYKPGDVLTFTSQNGNVVVLTTTSSIFTDWGYEPGIMRTRPIFATQRYDAYLNEKKKDGLSIDVTIQKNPAIKDWYGVTCDTPMQLVGVASTRLYNGEIQDGFGGWETGRMYFPKNTESPGFSRFETPYKTFNSVLIFSSGSAVNHCLKCLPTSRNALQSVLLRQRIRIHWFRQN